ncbi:hypothetical protein GOV11_04790 [Candidatus Woesearchaeota archaeon]|nr:hypothetical protein [Candidatus Woesearchaeota archaeon]
MVSKNITITEEAYKYLKNVKGKRSFSEVILSLSRSSDDIMQFAGSMKDLDSKSIENVREDANRDWSNRG